MNQNPEKLGCKWKPIYTDGNFNYELVEDENAEGTQKNPIEWQPGMMVREYFFYTDGKDTYSQRFWHYIVCKGWLGTR